MTGRNAKPVGLLVMEGRARLTKKEIERRKQLEIKLGSSNIVMSAEVAADPVAKSKFLELAELYDGQDYITSSDNGAINELCLLVSERALLRRQLAQLEDVSLPKEQRTIAYDLFEDEGGRAYARAVIEKVDFLLSTAGALAIHKAINSKTTTILALEDRLFLNALSKIKSIPKKPEEPKQSPLNAAGFGEV